MKHFYLFIFLLLTLNLFSQSNAPSIQSGVSFQWVGSQADEEDEIILQSITINEKIYDRFEIPTGYELTQVGPSGHNQNKIREDGDVIFQNSSNAGWNAAALSAFQDSNLNHYFESNNNGRNICDKFIDEENTTAQRQTMLYNPGIITRPNGLVVVTERNANNCFHIELFGIPQGGGTEQSLGETFVNTDGVTQWGYGGTGSNGNNHGTPGTTNPPPADSDYWLADRLIDNGGTPGIAIFRLDDIAPNGSIITKAQLTAATNDHGDGKIFIVTVNETNAVNDKATTLENYSVSGNLLTNDFDPGYDTQSFSGFEDPNNPGTYLASNQSVTTPQGVFTPDANGNYTFDPAAGFTGTVSVNYQVCDDGSPVNACAVASLTIDVLPVPDPTENEINVVVANNDSNTSYGNQVNGNVTVNDFDPQEDNFTVTSADIPLGTPTVVQGTNINGNMVNAGLLTLQADGSYVFSPCTDSGIPDASCQDDFTGTFSVDYTITDDNTSPETSSATLRINVLNDDTDGNGQNPPFADDDYNYTNQNESVSGNWAVNDNDPEDGAGINLTLSNPPTTTTNGGSITFNSDGTYDYTPAAGFKGPDYVEYTVCDSAGDCAMATVHILVYPGVKDFGDLPNNYPAISTINSPDANNDQQPDGDNAIWLGTGITYEASMQYSPTASADADDGLNFPVSVPNASTDWDIEITLNSNVATQVYYGRWIDWDADGSFDNFYNGSAMTSSPVTVTESVPVPATYNSNDNIFIRALATQNPVVNSNNAGEISFGEIEDSLVSLAVLPVELTDFSAELTDGDALIQWRTQSEINNDYFTLQYSFNGLEFHSLTTIEGNGTTTASNNYSYVHENVNALNTQVIYYRLKQVDFDGNYDLSDIVALNLQEATNSFTVSPNPAQRGTTVTLLGKQIKEVQVYDMNGRISYVNEYNSTDIALIPTGNLAAGTYIVVINQNEKLRLIVH